MTARYSLRELRAMAEGLPVKLKPGDAELDVWLAKLAPEKRELFIDVVRNAMRAEHQRPGGWQKFVAEIIKRRSFDAACLSMTPYLAARARRRGGRMIDRSPPTPELQRSPQSGISRKRNRRSAAQPARAGRVGSV